MFPPALSPHKNVRDKSIPGGRTDLASALPSHSNAAKESSYAAGYFCSGARLQPNRHR
jgi:hypothetical protein